jgi:hypothetical protein
VLEQGGGRAAGRIPTDSAPLALSSDLGAPTDSTGLCGAWALLGTCGSIASSGCCTYRHAFGSEQEKATAQKLRARHQRQASIAEELIASLHARWESQRPGALVRVPWCLTSVDPAGVEPKAMRAVLFARFLIETYGAEYLNSGSGVLDVAGGRGDLSRALSTEYGINTTVVDPSQKPPRPGGHPPAPAGARASATNSRSATTGTVAQLVECFDQDFGARHPDLLATASLLVGLHPDQPTGDISIVANTRHGTPAPFALVRSRASSSVLCSAFVAFFNCRWHRGCQSPGLDYTFADWDRYLVVCSRSFSPSVRSPGPGLCGPRPS